MVLVGKPGDSPLENCVSLKSEINLPQRSQRAPRLTGACQEPGPSGNPARSLPGRCQLLLLSKSPGALYGPDLRMCSSGSNRARKNQVLRRHRSKEGSLKFISRVKRK